MLNAGLVGIGRVVEHVRDGVFESGGAAIVNIRRAVPDADECGTWSMPTPCSITLLGLS